MVRRALLLAGLLLVLRLSIAAKFPGTFDVGSYRIVAELTLAGENVYAGTDRYNYSPLWSYIVAGIWAIARPNFSLFVLLITVLLTLADAATALLLFLLARRRLGWSLEVSLGAALLFFSNPVSVAISCAQGQFDGLAILCLMGAISAAMHDPGLARRPAVAAFLALSLLVKHVTLFHPLLFWKRIRRGGLPAGFLVVPYLVFGASFLPFLPASGGIAENVLLYPTRLLGPKRQLPGVLYALAQFPSHATVSMLLVFVAAVASAVWVTRHVELPRACLQLFLAMLVFLPSFGSQYLVWPVALGALYPGAAYVLFSTAAALYQTRLSLKIPWPIVVTEPAVWVCAALWLWDEARRISPEAITASDTFARPD